MEIYGAGRWMRPSSPTDSRRDKKYSLMNSIKCEFGHARPATDLPAGRHYLSSCSAVRGKEGEQRYTAALRLDRWQGQTVAAGTASNVQLIGANRITTTQLNIFYR